MKACKQRPVAHLLCPCGRPACAHFAGGAALCRRCYNTAYHRARYATEPDFRRRHIASVTRWKQRGRRGAAREMAAALRLIGGA